MTADTLFILTAHLIAERGTCIRAKVGSVITLHRRIVSTGYVGAPPDALHCIDVGCSLGPDGGCTRTIHAEANAISYAARHGLKVEGGTMYSTHAPCRSCAQLILSAGIERVVYTHEYRDGGGLSILLENHAKVRQFGSYEVGTPKDYFDHPFIGHNNEKCLVCNHPLGLHS